MELRSRVTGDDVIVRRLAFPHAYGRPSQSFTRRAGEIGRDAVRAEAPEGVTKRLKGSIDFATDPGNPSLWARVYTNEDYAPYVEEGTRPHMPPVAAITPWALAKGIPPWALAMWIKRFGTMPNRFMHRGLERARVRMRALITMLGRDIERAAGSG